MPWPIFGAIARAAAGVLGSTGGKALLTRLGGALVGGGTKAAGGAGARKAFAQFAGDAFESGAATDLLAQIAASAIGGGGSGAGGSAPPSQSAPIPPILSQGGTGAGARIPTPQQAAPAPSPRQPSAPAMGGLAQYAQGAIVGGVMAAQQRPRGPSVFSQYMTPGVAQMAQDAPGMARGAATDLLTGGLIGLSRSVLEATGTISRWTDGVLSSQRQLANYSGTLAGVFAREEAREIRRAIRSGAVTGQTAGGLVDAQQDLQDAIQPLRDEITRRANQFLTIGNRMLATLATIATGTAFLAASAIPGSHLLGRIADWLAAPEDAPDGFAHLIVRRAGEHHAMLAGREAEERERRRRGEEGDGFMGPGPVARPARSRRRR